jgi:hypothetical protein
LSGKKSKRAEIERETNTVIITPGEQNPYCHITVRGTSRCVEIARDILAKLLPVSDSKTVIEWNMPREAVPLSSKKLNYCSSVSDSSVSLHQLRGSRCVVVVEGPYKNAKKGFQCVMDVLFWHSVEMIFPEPSILQFIGPRNNKINHIRRTCSCSVDANVHTGRVVFRGVQKSLEMVQQVMKDSFPDLEKAFTTEFLK